MSRTPIIRRFAVLVMATLFVAGTLPSAGTLDVNGAFAGKGGNGGGDKGGNGGGNKGGNDHGGGNKGGNGGAGGKSDTTERGSKGATSKAKPDVLSKKATVDTSRKLKKAQQQALAKKHAAISLAKAKKEKAAKLAKVKLGALSAAHASPKAFAHAAQNSRIGKLRAYFLADAAADQAASGLGALQTERDRLAGELEAAKAKAAELLAVYEKAQGETQLAKDKLDAALLDPASDPAIVEALKTEYASRLAAEAVIKADLDLASDLTDEQEALDEATAKLETASTEADALSSEAERLLQDASNKPVTPEMREAVDKLLAGKIEIPPPETETPDADPDSDNPPADGASTDDGVVITGATNP